MGMIFNRDKPARYGGIDRSGRGLGGRKFKQGYQKYIIINGKKYKPDEVVWIKNKRTGRKFPVPKASFKRQGGLAGSYQKQPWKRRKMKYHYQGD